MATKNGRNVKIASGITIFAVAAAMGIYFNLTDRASESGEAKATVKMEVEAVSIRVDRLEKHEAEADKILNGKDGLVSTVEVIKTKIDNIEKQGDRLGEQNKLILEKLDDLKK